MIYVRPQAPRKHSLEPKALRRLKDHLGTFHCSDLLRVPDALISNLALKVPYHLVPIFRLTRGIILQQ